MKYIIDANLPYYFSLWNIKDEFIHVYDINLNMSDADIWDYAVKNNLTIVTKDKDFSSRILFHTPPPKVIHIRTGNLKLKDFYNILSHNWSLILNSSEHNKLVTIYPDRIESID